MFKDEIEVISHFKYIIVHNEIMKQYLVEKGINESKIYILELFDYICDDKEKIEYNKTIENRLTVIYAGNLAKNKSPFIYELNKEKMDYTINLYGKGIDESINDKILYKGAFKPEELPNKMNGDIGLIWDGNFDERDQNEGFKNYTKYNNPHKLSCYLAMGVPVIVWEKSAIANLVKKYNVGYTIENLYEINNLNIKDYNEKRKNVKELQNKVINGYYTKRVLEEIIEDIKNEKINN